MQWHTARGLKDGTRDGVVVQRLKRHTMASCATSSKTATMRVVLHGILCCQLSITCVGGSIGFHGWIDKCFPFSRGVHDVVRCESVAFLPGMPDIRCLLCV